MLLVKCPVCKVPINNKIRLFLFSNKNTKACPNCNSILVWSKKSIQLAYGIMVFLGVFSSRLINNLMNKGLHRELVWLGTLICLIYIVLKLVPRLTVQKR